MKKERTVIISYAEEAADPKMPVYFMNFINEAARVISEKEKKEKEKKEKETMI